MRGGLLLAGALGLMFTADLAQALETEVNATSQLQIYALRSPYGDPRIRYRRYTQTLGLEVYGLEGGADQPFEPGQPRLFAKVRLRLDADYGQSSRERDQSRDDRFVPGLQQSPVDMMYGYVEGQNYAGGWLGFRLGRQYVIDSLGWWSFDGALVRLTTPAYFRLEGYGGFEQRGGLPMLSTRRFESQGVARGDRFGLETDQWPSYLDDTALAPAWGAAIETAGLHWLSARASYRRVTNRDVVYISPFPDESGGYNTVKGDRVSSERAGAAARIEENELGALEGELVYDLLTSRVAEYAGALSWYATNDLTLGFDYEYYLPIFDGDSIFNWFSQSGSSTALTRFEWRTSRSLDIAASVGARTYRTEGDPVKYEAAVEQGEEPSRESSADTDILASLNTDYRWGRGSVAFDSFTQLGDRGYRWGGDITTRQLFASRRYEAMVVLSLHEWSDDLRPQRDATSFGYVLGGGYNIDASSTTRLGLQWEHYANRLVGQRYRLLATLDFSLYR